MRDIGVDVKPPERECSDEHCPFHGHLKVRGQIIEGTVVSDRMNNSVVVQKDYLRYIKKYERYEKRRSRILAHNPPCISARVGERVKIMECRPISKAKSFVVIEKEAEE
ncbi:MAG: 30S ribosomal protein S17 [Euryarchaeota archaeon]|nr:30S ribosomal protein S17 [Euryarchaeota archaeon]